MNPYFMSLMIGTILGLKRICPKCERIQIVPSYLRHQMVRCKFCGAEILSDKVKHSA